MTLCDGFGILLENNEKEKEKGGKMDKLIRQLIEKEPSLNIVLDEAPQAVIVPVILNESDTDIPENIGRLEYQVSDAVAGERSYSMDVYTWGEAKKAAIELDGEM